MDYLANSSSDLSRCDYTRIFVVVILGNIGLPVPEKTMLVVAGYLVWSGWLQLTALAAVHCFCTTTLPSLMNTR